MRRRCGSGGAVQGLSVIQQTEGTAGDTPYSVEDVSYDPDYAAMRAIVQLEVL